MVGFVWQQAAQNLLSYLTGRQNVIMPMRLSRTSTETLRQATTDEQGNAAQQVVEYAVLDRAGRVQLPRGMTRALGMRDRVRLESRPGHIAVWPDDPQAPPAPAPPPAEPGGPPEEDR